MRIGLRVAVRVPRVHETLGLDDVNSIMCTRPTVLHPQTIAFCFSELFLLFFEHHMMNAWGWVVRVPASHRTLPFRCLVPLDEGGSGMQQMPPRFLVKCDSGVAAAFQVEALFQLPPYF